MMRRVTCMAMLLGLLGCGGEDDAESVTIDDVQLLRTGDGSEPAAVESIRPPDGAGATGASCQPVFVSCNPRTCDGLNEGCDIGEFFSDCIDLLNFHCGPR